MSMRLSNNHRMRKVMTTGLTVCTLGLLAGCHTDMWTQPKARPLQESDFFADGNSSRPLVAGTVARRQPGEPARVGNPFFTGRDGKRLVDALPAKVLEEDKGDLRKTLLRGRERFEIYCSPCHGQLGDGKGMIAQRGLTLRKTPGNYHTNRLRRAPIGHFFNVMTNGFGVMYSYASRIEPSDRWRIAAYIRVLQYSQNARVSEMPPDILSQLTGAAHAAPAAGAQPGAEH
jgi:mono/diheme cytochrome c family protein